MKAIIGSFFRQLFFWLLFFALTRLIFIVYHIQLLKVENIGIAEVMQAFWYALPLDISTVSYILIIPFLILMIQSVYTWNWLNINNKIYTALLILIYSLITTSELGIYEEWKTKLNYKALHYLKHPDEVFNSAQTGNFIFLVILFFLQISAAIYLYNRFFYKNIKNIKRNYVFSALFLMIMPVLLFLGIRGGWQEIPINQSQSYYSNHNLLNLAAVNSGYNMLGSTLENRKFLEENPFLVYDMDEAKEIVEKLHTVERDTTSVFLSIRKPNIVLILLESWSADLIESLGGEPGITPEFEKLTKEGILFTNLYASGNRSEQAMSSIFGGFPSTPITAITHNLDKVTKLPSMIRILNTEGYASSFYFGGQLIYGGIKSYITIAEFDKIYEIYDFDKELPQGKLGIHDEFVFDRLLNDMDKEKEPFFSAFFTLSTHSPFDQPMDKVLDWGGNENEYINSAYYTDWCIGEFLKSARKKSWYDQTLFILVADHSHNSYRNWPVTSPQYRRIPLLFYGNVIMDEYKGKKISQLSSQTDIPRTILCQLELDSDQFFWSRNLFNPFTQEFAFYEANEGVGWIRPSGHFVYNNLIDHYLELDLPPAIQDSVIKEGKAYLQVLFQEFMDF